MKYLSKYLLTVLVALTASAGTIFVFWNYVPLDWISVVSKNLGSTITTIQGSDTLSASRSVINTNFSNLNTDKIETTNIDTCAEIASIVSGETGSCGSVVFSSSPSLATPTLTSPAFAGTATGLFTVLAASTTYLTVDNYFNAATFLGVATVTPAFRFSVGTAGSDFYINSSGKVVALDTTNSWNGRLNPTRSFVLGTGTTTNWTASTTGVYVPFITMPFAGTVRQVRCQASTTASFLGVAPYINTTALTPSYFVASSTVGVVKFTANNTFVAGDRVAAYFGTTTSDSAAVAIDCAFEVTETP